MKKIFLGGTCNGSNWRDALIWKATHSGLDCKSFFNPVVDEWTPECVIKENYEKQNSDFCLYVVTPLMTGVYTIAELVEDSNKRPSKTLFCILKEDGYKTFNVSQLKPLEKVKKLVVKNGAEYFNDLDEKDDTFKTFNTSQLKSLEQVKNLVVKNGVKYFNDLDEIVDFLKLFQ